jgi:hypothetical protein
MHVESEMIDMASLYSKAFGPRYVALVLSVCLVMLFLAVRETLTMAPAERMQFSEMYAGADSLGIKLSDKLVRLRGKKVRMVGFMAPPLKPTLSFFVLASAPLSICPFCSSDADWPSDIIMVKLAKPVVAAPFDRPIWVEGTLEVGSEVDEETGFVSLVRILADRLGVEDEAWDKS